MKFSRPAPRADSEAGLIPLINVVFLLLIFLLLAGSLNQREAFPVDPPVADSGEAAPAEPLVVLVARDGRLAVSGRQVSEAELLGLVANPAREGPAAVSLKADAAAEAIQLVALLEKLRAAGVDTITLMTARNS